ncbi:MAG: hypothetical protein IPJ19_10485 [Planctomycetes bacterium]|nr:hypothetical protein [Planctomycetota bacterium]
MRQHFPRLLVALLGLVLATPASAGVLVVAPSGAPFTTIQAAVDASVDGDTILVKSGAYPGNVSIDGRGISIVGDPAGTATVTGAISVQNIGAGKTVLLEDFRFLTQTLGSVHIQNCAGSVRLEALTSLPQSVSMGDALVVLGCADVGILRCNLFGSHSCLFPCPATSGLVATNSNVAVYDSLLQGGVGSAAFYIGTGGSSLPALEGGVGCVLSGTGSFFASNTTVLGGRGGQGLPGTCFPFQSNGGPGAQGGTGMSVAPGVSAWLIGISPLGGLGGAGGAGATSCGTSAGPTGPAGTDMTGLANSFLGASRVLACAAHLRESNALPLTLQGQPGDLVWIRAGFGASWSLNPAMQGVALFETGARRAFLGVVPASGTLQTSLSFGDLGLGVEARTYHFQAIFRDLAGATHLGSAASVVVLDSAY